MVKRCSRDGKKGFKPDQGGTCYVGNQAKRKAIHVERGIKRGVSKVHKEKDKWDYIDFLQVLGGSFLGVILVLFSATIAPPSATNGIILFFFILLAVSLSIAGIMRGFYPKRLFFFILTAVVVAYPFSSILGLLVGDITFQTLFSLEYFKTVTFASFLIGTSTGAIVDASRG